MHYLIQENVFREIHYDYIFEALRRLGLPYEVVRLNGTADFEFQTDRKDVFCFGSIRLAHLAEKYAWQPGSLFNAQHDYTVYADYWKDNLLNWDSKIQTIEEPIDFYAYKLFIRPTKDSKIFTGQLFSAADWVATQESALQRGHQKALIQVAIPKKIYQEVRCWIVDKKVVSASTYKLGAEVRYIEYHDADGLTFAHDMAQIFQPAAAFVLDICSTEQGWKIVELNCINSAGFYACNLQKLLMSLEDFYESTSF